MITNDQLGVVAKAKKAAAAAPLLATMPTASMIFAACTIPTLLGYWKSEYGVSYACEFALPECPRVLAAIIPRVNLVFSLHPPCDMNLVFQDSF